jgi:hypothetical protein
MNNGHGSGGGSGGSGGGSGNQFVFTDEQIYDYEGNPKTYPREHSIEYHNSSGTIKTNGKFSIRVNPPRNYDFYTVAEFTTYELHNRGELTISNDSIEIYHAMVSFGSDDTYSEIFSINLKHIPYSYGSYYEYYFAYVKGDVSITGVLSDGSQVNLILKKGWNIISFHSSGGGGGSWPRGDWTSTTSIPTDTIWVEN